MKPAIPYTDSVEQPEKNEAELNAELIETMLKISKKTYADSGHAMRSVHVKSHGLLVGKLEVLPHLPAELAQGMFAEAAAYPVVMRFSVTPGDILPDSVSTPRGLAVKIIGVKGERLPGSEDNVTQDFVTVNGPSFQTAHAKEFLANLKLLAATTDKGEGAKVALSATLRGTEKVIESLGGNSPKIRNMGGEPAHHPLGETYYTQVPLLYGNYMAKLSIAPVTPSLKELKDKKIAITEDRFALRKAVVEYFQSNIAEWEVRIQLCRDLDKMPIENAKKIWPENESPYLPVARITVQPQIAWSEARSRAIEDGLLFSPWHGLAAHRPLGSIMRLRKLAYKKSAQYRSERNAVAVEEPKSIDFLTDIDKQPDTGK